MTARLTLPLALICSLALWMFAATGCASSSHAPTPQPTGLRGHLMIIGGGLDDDNKHVYERFIALAKANAGTDAPLILIATAASGNQEPAATGKVESIRAYCPTCRVETIMRETPTAQTVALIERAHAMFFTGGDQKRITARYLTADGAETPESAAIRALLARGGVIAGTSAGDAMMSDPMFFTGRSAEALGIRSTRTGRGPDDDADDRRAQPPLGPQIGKGMGLIPWLVTDSHFFERHRFGRLVAALESSGHRLGLGVGEDACVEVDLSTGDAVGVSVADSLLVDVGGLWREGLARHNVRALVVQQGTRINLPALLAAAPPGPAPARPQTTTVTESITEPGQNRQLASWRFFLGAQQVSPPTIRALTLDGYSQTAWPDGRGWSVVTITPQSK